MNNEHETLGQPSREEWVGNDDDEPVTSVMGEEDLDDLVDPELDDDGDDGDDDDGDEPLSSPLRA